MQIPAAELEPVRVRLARAQGQIGGVMKMLEEGRDCTEILTQLAAAQAALSRAGFALISSGIAHCAADESGLADRAKLEKAFLSLA